MFTVRYADDFKCGFQYKEDAENFYKALQHQVAKFSLTIQKKKNIITAFGRFAATIAYKTNQKCLISLGLYISALPVEVVNTE